MSILVTVKDPRKGTKQLHLTLGEDTKSLNRPAYDQTHGFQGVKFWLAGSGPMRTAMAYDPNAAEKLAAAHAERAKQCKTK
jgi:hypothetical protein